MRPLTLALCTILLPATAHPQTPDTLRPRTQDAPRPRTQDTRTPATPHPQPQPATPEINPGAPRPEALSITIPAGNTLRIEPFGYAAPLIANSAELLLPMDTGASGGQGVVSTIRAYTTIRGAPDANLWPILGVVDYVGTGGTGQHVPIYGQGIRRAAPAPGGAANNPQIWGGVFQSMDMTGTPSSRANAQLSVENDLNVGNVDDVNARQGLVQVLGTFHRTGPDGQPIPAVPAEASRAIGITTDEYGQWKRQIHPTGNYQTASIDLRDAKDNGANSGARPVVTQALSVPSDTIHVSNVMPFTSDQFGRDINQGHRSPVTINGVAYVQSGYAIAGAGPAGTLTFAGPVQPRDAHAAAPVRNASHTLWLGTGQDIALDTLGTVRLNSDGSGLAVQVAGAGSRAGFTPALQVHASRENAAIALIDPADQHGWAIAGGRDFAIAQTAPPGDPDRSPSIKFQIDRTTGATRLASFPVRDLPRVGPAQQGEIAYATDCRNPDEQESDGSGCLVTVNRRGRWAAVWSGRPPAR